MPKRFLKSTKGAKKNRGGENKKKTDSSSVSTKSKSSSIFQLGKNNNGSKRKGKARWPKWKKERRGTEVRIPAVC